MNFEKAVNNTIKTQECFDNSFRYLCGRVVAKCIVPENFFVACPMCGGIAYPKPEVFEYEREDIYYCSECGNTFKSGEAV